ncbi:MAG: hypothetical protein ACI841_001848 [Planctomycetota bacterium]|jgi:hypothetical protein
MIGFQLLRATSLYGDPIPWADQTAGGVGWITFLNCEKYGPSLLFVMMTLGPALLFLCASDRGLGKIGPILTTFRSVSLFYYVAHIYLLHGAPDLVLWLQLGGTPNLLSGHFPEGYGEMPLSVTYAAWFLAVGILYFPCRCHARFKSTRTATIWTYL